MTEMGIPKVMLDRKECSSFARSDVLLTSCCFLMPY